MTQIETFSELIEVSVVATGMVTRSLRHPPFSIPSPLRDGRGLLNLDRQNAKIMTQIETFSELIEVSVVATGMVTRPLRHPPFSIPSPLRDGSGL